MEIDEIRRRVDACFLPVVQRLPLALVEGRGARLRDAQGREYVDLTAGWGVTCIGHCHPRLVEAVARQAGRLMQTTNLFYTLPQLELLERLTRLAPAPLARAFLVNSGAEAMEVAVKIAHRATGRSEFVSAEGSFHGRTLGALRLIGQARHREPYAALLPEPRAVPFDDLEAARAAVDESCAAFVVEPLQGDAGVHVPHSGYLSGLREICDAAGALLILDEVQTGIGRTGAMFAAQHEGVVPDVLTLGKGLGGGFPVAAALTSERVAQTVQLGDHGTTFGGNPMACAAAEAVLRVVEEEKLAERAAALGERLMGRLRGFAEEHPDRVEAVRGRGLLIGLVARDAEALRELPLRALERGVIANVTAGRVLRFFPPLNIPEEDLWPAVESVLALVAGS